MTDEREQIAQSILGVLRRSTESLKAREIADALHRLKLVVTRASVNSVLYNELSRAGAVVQDSQYRWSVRYKQNRTIEKVDRDGREASDVSLIGDNWPPTKNDCRTARRVLHVLRSGTTSCRAANAVSVGTSRIAHEVYRRTDSLRVDEAKDEMVVIAADWGFGKSHMRMLISGHLSDLSIPFVHECIDARAASLSHIHRSVPRWLEHIQFGRTLGLRDALNNGKLSTDKALEWARNNYSDFAHGLRAALGGYEWGWLRALGHLYRSPDYPYQHLKAWSLIESAATFLNRMGCGGLVLLLDEAENIDKQYDIRGRRKSYETLARMARHPHILPVIFVTNRLLYQVQQDAKQGIADEWWGWSTAAKWFVEYFQVLQPLRPPRLTDGLAEQLVSSIAGLYRTAYPGSSPLSPQLVLKSWRQTPTRSTRLLVRLTINELDLLMQKFSEEI